MPTALTIPMYGSGASARTLTVQAANLLSQTNMRLYRQSMNYKVKISLTDQRSEKDELFQIFTLPNTWLTNGAVKHAFRMYKLAMHDELKQTGGKSAKWHDFRISASDADGTDTAARALGFDGNSWNLLASQADNSLSMITPDSGDTEVGFHAVGNKANSFNIITEYVKHILSKGEQAQASVGPQSYEGLIDSADDLDNLMERGDLPPYDADFAGWAGDASADSNTTLQYQDTLFVDSDGSQRMVSKTFDAPLGLVWIYAADEDLAYTGNPQFTLHVSPGKYKGVDATPILNYNL